MEKLQSGKVVSDLLRFEYEKQLPRKRSRNPSPAEIKPPILSPFDNDLLIRNFDEGLNLSSSGYDMRDELYDFYAGTPSDRAPHTTPYPNDRRDRGLENPPLPPPKDVGDYRARNVLDYDELPSVQEPAQYINAELKENKNFKLNMGLNFGRREYTSHDLLLENLMNYPLFGNVHSNNQGMRNYTFTINNVIDFLQIAFGVIITTISSVLASIDTRVSLGLYRYFIAAGVILLVVALLFISKSINFERRHGVFYSLFACILTCVLLVLSITSIANNNNCYTSQICQLRKVLATFSILSFFLWMCHLVIFLTVNYVCNIILLKKIDLDLEPNEKHMSTVKGDVTSGYLTDTTVDDRRFSQNCMTLPHYYFDSNGKMYPMEKNQDLRGTRPMMVYASESLFR